MDKLKILLATDFSPRSRNTLKLIPVFQKAYKLQVVFVHIIKSFWKDWWSIGLYKKEAIQRLKIWQQEAVGKSNPNNLLIEYGNPGDLIIHCAKLMNVNIILLGGQNNLESDRYKTGATLESVVRCADQCVFISKKPTITNVLCGIDGSEYSKKSLLKAIDLCQHFSAKLSIVYVVPQFKDIPLVIEDEELEKRENVYKDEKVNEIKKFLMQFDLSKIAVKQYFPWGIPAHVLLDMAEDFEHDLIVMGAKGHSLLHHVLLGSTTEKVLRHTPCSLLVVR